MTALIEQATDAELRALVDDPATSPEVLAATLAILEREVYAWACGTADCDGLSHAGYPLRHARANQVHPAGDWLVWLMLAGRGFGKTRAGAEEAKDGYEQSLLRLRDARWALVAETFADGRDTMIEGESGLLSILPPSALRGGNVSDAWNRSLGELYLSNGSKAKIYSSETPGKLRGPQHHGAWGDEPAKWKDAHKGDGEDTTWSNLLLGLRLGPDPRCVLTTTPKRVRLLVGTKERPGLLKQDTTHVTRGSTYDNLKNLAATFRKQILSKYEGTRLGRQELLAEVLEDVEGALWSLALIEDKRVLDRPFDTMFRHFTRTVTAVDPAVTSEEDSDDTGIVAAARTDSHWCPVCGPVTQAHAFVLGDWTCHVSPDAWARRAVDVHDQVEGDRVVGEVNNGGDLVELTLRTVDPAVPYKKVHASKGKRVRAEPVAALYEQGRVHHLGTFPELEDEMTTWTQDAAVSPNRLDALVWALTDLMLGEERKRSRFRGAA